jgi:FkbM family methyltransferase
MLLETLSRPLRRARGIAGELAAVRMFRPSSWPRYLLDILAYRLMHFVRLPREGSRHTIVTTDGIALSYRLNRGDIQGIREIWRDEVYRPPADITPIGPMVDAGANIGFSSVYLARRWGATRIVAVEPDLANVALLRHNLEQNGIEAEIVEAAVGAQDGEAAFARNRDSNLGRLSDEGEVKVPLLSMDSILGRLGEHRGAFLKMDIEGAEAEVFAGDVSWLADIRGMMMEVHPALADEPHILGLLADNGMRFRAATADASPCWTRE